MAVARKSDVFTKRSWFQRNSLRTRNSATLKQSISRGMIADKTLSPPVSSRRYRRSSGTIPVSTSTPIPDLNQQGTTPTWLLRLYAIHRHSGIMAFVLVATTLVIYGWTVYSQQLWSQSYRKLQTLQRDERQLTTTIEVLKNKMAQEAQKPAAGLVSPSPASAIFLPPAPEDSSSLPSTTTSESNFQLQQQDSAPIGY
ncbi:hypothetical protein [Fischerella thermalis]|uniref:hypothetical protein n=1 Tax=Fischerella thermalis TaxID=372787 RepID=UPI000C803C95|nr:hypothetical protein [Fischerella thermalis]PLZ06071.1 hypothetical protein CBP18_19440 [Fischerella thermalis WC119]PMB53872.1 hypothetical protein CEN39_02050 [Fischerella thermalis CCMEE 5201]